ncbi:M20 metallopeptidase family protein [Marinisporobacter balticus]|uniref:Hippurate hydrolase n=1 Tax=Marinisporobacter balticus TaxID=2018667 RepID=A0A4R2KN18_9FIRM|nr:M20 family metallopeptidase [Marinisporobacter balticus]TCO71468.1 hippurate hydrolase [Marinisporobacter balticus]
MIHIEKEILDVKEEVVLIRRTLHQIPEIGFEEEKTSAFIIQKLEAYGIEVYKHIAKTGVVGYLKGTIGDRTIAFRADMDALSMEEKTDVDYASKHKGMMHACGHDAHMSIVLGLAKLLSMHKDKVKDNIVFLFQPAEEGPGGAEPMIEERVIEKFHIDKIMGLHVFPEVKEGKIGCKKGPLMAQTGEFDIKVYGQSGHGAMPQKANDAIIIASNLLSIYQTIISRNINPTEGAVLTIGKMWGGERRNIIAAEVCLEGTLRAFSEEVYKKMKKRMIEIANGIEKMYDCRVEVIFRDMYPAVNNDENMVEDLVDAIGGENIDLIEPQMIAEDFSYFQRKIPGIFFFLGVKNEEKGHIYPLHNSRFTFNEEVLLTGIQVYVTFLRHIKGVAQ